jgi:hypothetical protein
VLHRRLDRRGHNVAGRALAGDGLTIDLSLLKAIDVDPERKTARVGGGANWAELNEATQAHGLAVTGGVISTTGVAGLTLGGGLGWLMGKHGLALDSLTSAEVVTADGRVLTASETENADLFWALRGGGGNFGVVSTFEFRLHEVGPMVTGGLIIYPFPAAPELLRFYREFTADIPDELTAFGALIHAPDGSGAKLTGVAVCHVGTPEQVERDLAPLLSFGEPAIVQIGPMPYAAVNQMLDDGFPFGSLNYWKSGFLEELTDDAIDTMIDAFSGCPTPMGAMVLEHFHGAVTRVPLESTACALRRPGYNLVVPTVWLDPAMTEACVGWTRKTYVALEPFTGQIRYSNYLAEDEGSNAAARSAYGSSYDRLVEVKRAYDPENVFHVNVNIAP